MTNLQTLIARVRDIEQKATPGPWKPDHYITVDGLGEYDYFSSPQAPEKYPGGPRQIMARFDRQYAIDRECVALSRNLLGPLLDVAEHADRLCRTWEKFMNMSDSVIVVNINGRAMELQLTEDLEQALSRLTEKLAERGEP